VIRREHRAERRQHDVEGRVLGRDRLGITVLEPDLEALCLGAAPGRVQQ